MNCLNVHWLIESTSSGQRLCRTTRRILSFEQGGHGTGKTGNLAVNFSRQGKHREFSKFNFLHRENFENLEFFENFVIKVATR